MQPALKNNALDQRLQQTATNAHAGRGTALERLQRFAEAVSDWKRAIALNVEANRLPQLRTELAGCLARAGEPAQAIAEVNALAADPNITGEALYDLGCIGSLASTAVKNDAKIREQYAARAVELLRQAVAKGYKDIEHLKKDEELEALQGRADFTKLLMELGEKK